MRARTRNGTDAEGLFTQKDGQARPAVTITPCAGGMWRVACREGSETIIFLAVLGKKTRKR